VGQEICRIFARYSHLHLLMLLFYMFRDHDWEDRKFNHPHMVTWRDAAQAVRCALEVDLETLPSRCEVFSIFADLPHGRFSNEKAKRLLGWQPQDDLRAHWTRG
jgi:nucleoside-diphosphate-sugar epimerase